MSVGVTVNSLIACILPFQEHDTPTVDSYDGVLRTAFEKAAYFIRYRHVILAQDPDLRAILALKESLVTPPTSHSSATPPTNSPSPNEQ